MAHEIEVERPHWIWPDYIPAGKITVLAGDPGMGKSTIALDIVSRISQGTSMPTGGRSVSGTCLIASAEDAPEDTITPRLIAADANLKRVGIMREVMIDDEVKFLTFPRDLERMRSVIIKMGVRLVVIDPLNAFLERGTDSYKDQDIRSVLAPFEAIAQETMCAILIVAHLNKKEESSVLYRVGGSVGFTGAARSVLSVSKTQKDGIRVLYSVKTNLGKIPKALSYETRQARRERKEDSSAWAGESRIESSYVRWRGEVDFDPTKGPSVGDQKKAEIDAEDFLRQMLTDGELCTDVLYHEAKGAGVRRAQLNQVKTQLGIHSRRRNGKWYWKLPE